MKFNLLNKNNAEITSSQLVTIILVLAGFVILMIVFYQFGFTGTIDRQACHTSVIAKATFSGDILDVSGIIPLKCQVNKICITDKIFGKGDCTGFSKTSFNKVRVSGTGEAQETKIKQALAREMLEGWVMMGEGKVRIFEREFKNYGWESKCVVLSRIEADSSIPDKDINGFAEYLITHKAPDTEKSYWDYMFNSKLVDADPAKDTLDLSKEQAIVFIEFVKPKMSVATWAASGGIGGALLTGAIVGFGGIPAIITIGVGGTLGFVGGGVTGDKFTDLIFGKDDFLSGIFIMDYSDIPNLGCGSVEGFV